MQVKDIPGKLSQVYFRKLACSAVIIRQYLAA